MEPVKINQKDFFFLLYLFIFSILEKLVHETSVAPVS